MEMTRTLKQIRAYAEQRGLPVIPISAKNVSILREPSAFYKLLLDGVQSAKRRVALSALYIGTGSKEHALIDTLRSNLITNPQLDVSITLDRNRASRENHLGQSSVSMIHELLGCNTIRLKLIRDSLGPGSVLQRLLARFQRFNELSSTYHSKLMVFDDDVLITGANLSSIYFEERQDRYVRIKDSKLLGDYISGFLDNLQKPSEQSLGATIDRHNNQFISDHLAEDIPSDCYVIPLCQIGRHDVRACDDLVMFLNEMLPHQAEIHMSTGYFNPKIKMRLNSVIAPSEQANGFYEGGGLLRYVPRLYTVLMRNYLKYNPNCELYTYNRPGWSYHAKGLWVDGSSDIGIYMIGSSNFNWRSSERDFEIQFLLLTSNRTLKQSFKTERDYLLGDSNRFKANESHASSPIYTLAANLLKSLL